MTREYTNKILEAIEDGILNAEDVVRMCMSYMPESEVEDMCQINELFVDADDDYYDESMDGDFDSAMASAGLGTDEDYGFYGDE